MGRDAQDQRLEPTDRTRLRRGVDRGRHDRATIHAVLDAGLICHVGFALEGRPWVFPTAFARAGDDLYLHGARANFGLRSIASGLDTCVTVTVLDGLVLSRAAFHHSMNYRSVMLFGRAHEVSAPDEKRRALLAIVDHMVPGRAADARPPTAEELRATIVVRVPIVEGSAKVRTGGPGEDPEDIGLPYWAGALPLGLVAGEPVADRQAPGDEALDVPDYLREWAVRRAR